MHNTHTHTQTYTHMQRATAPMPEGRLSAAMHRKSDEYTTILVV